MIYLPPPQPVLNKDIRISGDIEIHPTASLAPGVILQAAPGCSITIGADVCIGMGVIINACQGAVTIDSGAILGSGVLIIGASKVGNNSCIGTSSTIFQHDIAPMAVIEPGSIVGDTSRSVNTDQAQPKNQTNQTESKSQQNGKAPESDGVNVKPKSAAKNSSNTVNDPSTAPQENSTTTTPAQEVATSVKPHVQSSKPPVVGQVYISELLVTLFPHKKDANSDFDRST